MKYAFFLALALVFSGCSTKPLSPEISFKPPKYVEQMPSAEDEDVENLGSLYGSGDNPLFSDRKAMRINDIVTVIITERASSSTKGSKKVERKNLSNLAPAKFSYDGSDAAARGLAKGIANATAFGFNSNTNSSFEGSGSNDRTDQFNTVLAARIVKVMANGNYFIEGSKEILVNGEKQVIQLSGVARSYDIDLQNRINSNLIADARILYKTEGDVESSVEKGWGTKLLSFLWPF
ncbi:MAG: flagellar basal body L-ring protein FlgH [Helicobacteraceae bacterium]